MAAFEVVANQLFHGPTHIQHARWILEQLLVARIPGHQPHVGIDHADGLIHVFQGGQQDFAVEAQLGAGLVQHLHHCREFHAGALQGAGEHQPRRCRPHSSCQQQFGEVHPGAIGARIGPEWLLFALRLGHKGLAGGALANDAASQCLQIAHAQVAGQRRCVGRGMALCRRVEERIGLQLFGQAGGAHDGHQQHGHDVHQQRPERAVAEAVHALQPQQRVRMQPCLPEQPALYPVAPDDARRSQLGQQQRVGPDGKACQQPGLHALAADTAPVQPGQQRGGELRHRNKRHQPQRGQLRARLHVA